MGWPDPQDPPASDGDKRPPALTEVWSHNLAQDTEALIHNMHVRTRLCWLTTSKHISNLYFLKGDWPSVCKPTLSHTLTNVAVKRDPGRFQILKVWVILSLFWDNFMPKSHALKHYKYLSLLIALLGHSASFLSCKEYGHVHCRDRCVKTPLRYLTGIKRGDRVANPSYE